MYNQDLIWIWVFAKSLEGFLIWARNMEVKHEPLTLTKGKLADVMVHLDNQTDGGTRQTVHVLYLVAVIWRVGDLHFFGQLVMER